jgi:hypothetical protein
VKGRTLLSEVWYEWREANATVERLASSCEVCGMAVERFRELDTPEVCHACGLRFVAGDALAEVEADKRTLSLTICCPGCGQELVGVSGSRSSGA